MNLDMIYQVVPNDKTKGIDGIFGMKTWKAVLDFQRKNNLEARWYCWKNYGSLKKQLSKAGYTVKVTASLLNVLVLELKILLWVWIRKNATYKLLEIKDGWGRIASPAGWISLIRHRNIIERKIFICLKLMISIIIGLVLYLNNGKSS